MAEFEKDEQKTKNAICFIKATQELLDTCLLYTSRCV